tara:strand:+ start:20776 stop:21036 length:261 start_codon:yes stop_codon:yes gene_type:complete
MGGEGSMMAANNSLKNNRSLISKRKEKSTLSGSYSNLELKEFPKTTPEDLAKLREKIMHENQVLRKKQWFVFCILTAVLVAIIYFY